MKLFGSIKELVSAVFRKDSQEITLRPNQSTTYTAARDIQLPPGDANHVVVSASSTQTLTNKTIDADDNTISDLADANIKAGAAINAAKIADGSVDNTEFQKLGTAGTAGAGNLVTTDGTQTLTNKTITSPSGLTKADVGLGNVDNTSDATKNSAIATLTNKTIDGDDNTIQDLPITSLKTVLADANKVLRRDASGVPQSGNAIPNSSALVTTDASQTLTGKTIDGDDNTVQDLPDTALKTNLTNASKFFTRNASGVPESATKAVPTGVVVGDSDSQTLSNKTLATPTVTTGAVFSNQAYVELREQTGNGSNYIRLTAPDAVTNNTTLKFPDGAGSGGQFLQTDGSGSLSWATAAAVTPNIRSSEGAGTTTLTISDSKWQVFDLSAGRTCVLPTTGVVTGDLYILQNRSNNLLTVQSSNGSEITTSAAGSGSVGTASIRFGFVKLIALQNTPTTPAHWLVAECQEEGTYTPTLANEANTTSLTAYTTYYTRNNKQVIVNGRMDVDGNLTSFTTTQVRITLPKSSSLSNDYELAGVGMGSESGVGNMGAFIIADTVNDGALYKFNNSTTANREHWFTFKYVLL